MLYHYTNKRAKVFIFVENGQSGNYVTGANIAGFMKAADAMMSRGMVWSGTEGLLGHRSEYSAILGLL